MIHYQVCEKNPGKRASKHIDTSYQYISDLIEKK